ncbi:GvpL/GvpF family gas vesicle protein [Streptomyces rhizosphaerihabitans]|uniref:GvpL/GvpF family gas vesicle protein n=1 Tax=Streptomyces rhizosphaerihabitans TaxID=1266770 RepID=UPI0021BE2A04|nr:GvpL/GvpF family gas vesicle protein [Streptomyces rhizosphaerihabitans]MCT9006647.1 GvpL/GvpF family gas vesicle protein [Streptomyces rhizosphaerihabitans]
MSALRYVYAICRPFEAALSAELAGVAGVPPKLLRHGGLIAVVGSVPEREFGAEPLRRRLEDVEWLEATARAHQGVIDALTAVTSPLPLRLATVLRDDSGVRVLMEERREDFLRTLDRLDGRVEWDVKVYTENTEAAGASVSSETVGAFGGTLERAEEFTRRLHGTLSRCAEETRLRTPRNPASSEEPDAEVLDAAYLVPRAESEEFVERVNGSARDEPGVRVELTGPWAAYSFTGSTGLTGFKGFTGLTGFARNTRNPWNTT